MAGVARRVDAQPGRVHASDRRLIRGLFPTPPVSVTGAPPNPPPTPCGRGGPPGSSIAGRAEFRPVRRLRTRAKRVLGSRGGAPGYGNGRGGGKPTRPPNPRTNPSRAPQPMACSPRRTPEHRSHPWKRRAHGDQSTRHQQTHSARQCHSRRGGRRHGAGTAGAAAQDIAPTSPLWAEFRRTPYTHPQIPYVGRAGRRGGAEHFPRRPVVANVLAYGAEPDGSADAAPAINRAIAAVGRTRRRHGPPTPRHLPHRRPHPHRPQQRRPARRRQRPHHAVRHEEPHRAHRPLRQPLRRRQVLLVLGRRTHLALPRRTVGTASPPPSRPRPGPSRAGPATSATSGAPSPPSGPPRAATGPSPSPTPSSCAAATSSSSASPTTPTTPSWSTWRAAAPAPRRTSGPTRPS